MGEEMDTWGRPDNLPHQEEDSHYAGQKPDFLMDQAHPPTALGTDFLPWVTLSISVELSQSHQGSGAGRKRMCEDGGVGIGRQLGGVASLGWG